MRGSIQHRPGRPAPWRARYRAYDGRERSKSFNRKIDAERWLSSELSELDRGMWIDPEHSRITWRDYTADLMAARGHLAARTIDTNVVCEQRVAPVLGHVEVGRISPELIRRLVAELGDAGYAPETIIKTMRWVRLVLNQAVSDRRIPRSPAAGIRLPTPRRSDMRILSPAQVDHLADTLPDRYRALPIVAAYTGLRWGELAGLQVLSIDMLRRRLLVRTALIEAARQPPQLGPPKTTASERTITLPNIVVDAFARHLHTYPPVDGTVFTTEKGAFLRRGSFNRIWRQAVTDSVGSPCRIHDLRHTHASWLIAAGEHPKIIQSRLGHSSIQVTMDRYGHLMEGLDERTADRLDALAAESRGPGVAQDPNLDEATTPSKRRKPA